MKQDYPEDEHIAQKMREEIAEGGQYGDRRQQVVIIGVHMDRTEVEALLDACLLTDEEFEGGPDAWLEMENPFFEEIFAGLELIEEDEEGEEGEEGEEDGEEKETDEKEDDEKEEDE